MAKLSQARASDYKRLTNEVSILAGCPSAEEAAQAFVNVIYDRFRGSLVLARLFITAPYAALPEEDRLFVDRRGSETNTSHLIHDATPIFTLLGTRGMKQEWNDRRNSRHFRCVPLASTAFVASLSMLSRQFASVGLELGMIDTWETEISGKGRADAYRGTLCIDDAARDRDEQGRMIVPKQEFVAEYGVKTVLGLGSGYETLPTLLTLFLFTGERLEGTVAETMAEVLECFRAVTEGIVSQGRLFRVRP